jgi:hypothetical protein
MDADPTSLLASLQEQLQQFYANAFSAPQPNTFPYFSAPVPMPVAPAAASVTTAPTISSLSEGHYTQLIDRFAHVRVFSEFVRQQKHSGVPAASLKVRIVKLSKMFCFFFFPCWPIAMSHHVLVLHSCTMIAWTQPGHNMKPLFLFSHTMEKTLTIRSNNY